MNQALEKPIPRCPVCGGTVAHVTVLLDFNAVMINGRVIKLSEAETEILYRLNESAPEPVSAVALGVARWGGVNGADTNQVRVFIHNLREKLSETDAMIETVPGRGWALVPRQSVNPPQT